MMLVHMEVHLKGYFLMSISLQKYTVCQKTEIREDILYGWSQALQSHQMRNVYILGQFIYLVTYVGDISSALIAVIGPLFLDLSCV